MYKQWLILLVIFWLLFSALTLAVPALPMYKGDIFAGFQRVGYVYEFLLDSPPDGVSSGAMTVVGIHLVASLILALLAIFTIWTVCKWRQNKRDRSSL